MKLQLFFRYGNCLKRYWAVSFILISIPFIYGLGHVFGQSNDYYTVTGRVIDDQGRPFPNAGICLEPVVYKSTAFDRFVKCIGTETDGRFSIKKYRNQFTIGQPQFLFVSVDNNLALTTVNAPFDLIRDYDRSFNGKLVEFGSKDLIDVGDVKVQFWHGQVNLKISQSPKNKIDWPHIWLKILNKNGHMAYFSTLSKDDIKQYLKNNGSELSISLPEGRWMAEIIEFDTRRVIAKSSYFDVRRNSNKNILMIANFRARRGVQ